MNVLLILAHPNIKSFNHAIAESAAAELRRRGHTVTFHDLYAERFDPLLSWEEMQYEVAPGGPIRAYCDELQRADGLVFVHPNWWGQPPAILKGWIDRVFQPGIAYAFDAGDGGGVPRGLLGGKIALVFNTADTPARREKAFFGDPLDSIWKKCVFEFCGIRLYFRKTFSVMVTSDTKERRRWLEEVEKAVGRFFP